MELSPNSLRVTRVNGRSSIASKRFAWRSSGSCQNECYHRTDFIPVCVPSCAWSGSTVRFS